MTSEAAVMNKTAVALAADSAITVGNEGEEKIFNTANKIFALSHDHPVGVMFYGNAEIAGVPIETIVKLFRKNLDPNGRSLIAEYAADFCAFLELTKFHLTKQDIIDTAIGMAPIYQGILSRARNRTSRRKDFGPALLREAEHSYAQLTHLNIMPVYSDLTYRRFMRDYGSAVDLALETAFGGMKISKTARAILSKCGHLGCVSEYSGSSLTGFVVAGFGEEEWFPSLEHIVIVGRICGKIKKFDVGGANIERPGPSGHIYAFAQKRTVSRFMDGVDPLYKGFVVDWLKKQLGNFAGEILRGHTGLSEHEIRVVERLVADRANAVVEQLNEDLAHFSQKFFSGPIVDVVGRCPKEELAHLAEALVNISSLERKVSGQHETVGGPIDVAIISKGDGLVWIKRKHYFSIDLNRGFMHRYGRPVAGASDGGDEGAGTRAPKSPSR